MAAPYVGLNECLEHDVGTGGTPSGTMLAWDKVESGNMSRQGGDIEYNIGVGGQVAKYRSMYTPHGVATTMLQTSTIMSNVLPTSIGSLPPVIAEIQGGPLTDTDAAIKHSDAYIVRFQLACEMGNVVRAEYEWLASDEDPETIASAASKQTNTPFPWENLDVQFNGAAYKCQSWQFEIRNTITPQSSQDAKTSDKRQVEWFDPGNVEYSLTATLRMPLGVDVTADFPSTFTFKVIGTNNDGTAKTLTLDCTGGNGFNLSNDPLEIVRSNEAVLYRIEATGEPDDLSLVSTLSIA